MNASFSAVLLLVLLAGGWLLGRRRPRPFLRSTDTSAVAALNRVQIERLQPPASPLAVVPQPDSAALTQPSVVTSAASSPVVGHGPGDSAPVLPSQAGKRQRSLRQLQVSMASGSREQRLQALVMAGQSSRRDVLPLLRLGLRDPDPEVMAAAAAAMVRFRGRPAADASPATDPSRGRVRPQPANLALSRPRSVLRTR